MSGTTQAGAINVLQLIHMILDGFRDSIRNGHGFRSMVSDITLRQLFMNIVNKKCDVSPQFRILIMNRSRISS